MTGSADESTPEHRFGQAVRRAREERGWSQEILATQLSNAGLNVGGQSGVARIERGARPTRLNEVVAISEFLLIDAEEVYGYSGDHLGTEEDVAEAKTHLLEILDAEEDAAVVIGKLQGDLESHRRLLSELERKHLRIRRALEHAGVDVDAIVHERLMKTWEDADTDGDR